MLRTKPPPLAAPARHLAAVDLHALADARRARARGRRSSARAVAVVADLDLQLVGAVADRHVGLAGVRVLERVGQALLDDPVGGQVDRARERVRLAVDVQAHRQAGAADLVHQRVEVAEPRLGRELDLLALAPHRAEQPAHLGERRAAGLLDAFERLPVLASARGSLCRTAPTWSTITLTAWATMSCSSRAIRARSSATAMRAAASRSRSACAARSSAASACSARSRIAKPASQAIANSSGVKTRSPVEWSGSL